MATPTATSNGAEFVSHEISMPFWKWFQTAFLTVVLLPPRVFLLILVVMFSHLVVQLGTAGLSREDIAQVQPRHPIKGWRRQVQKLLIILGRLAMFGAGFRVKVKGQRVGRHLAPILVVAPHSTFFDGMLLTLCDLPYIVSREENRNIPIFGKCFEFCQAIFVKREDPVSRSVAANEIKRRAQSPDNSWRQVLIFPEGSCSNRRGLLAFKAGAFFPGKPIQPVLLRYPNSIDTVTWTWNQSHGVKTIMWLTLTQMYTNVEVDFLPIYNPSALETRDPHIFARNVCTIMAKELNVPRSLLTFEEIKRVFDEGHSKMTQ